MAPPFRNQPHLPKSILQMKFMQKTKERLDKEFANTQDHEDFYSNIITDEMRQATGNFISEPSFLYCLTLMEGRQSFKGMNPEIERLMEIENTSEIPSDDMDKDVSDEILAKKFRTLKRNLQTKDIGPIAKKRK